MSYPPAYPPMPARGQDIAPKFDFDPQRPQELRRYFEDLATLFQASNVIQDQEKKRYARRYVDLDTYDLWESLSEYQSPYSWDQFIAAVHKLYPGSEDDRKWSIADMDKLIGEQLRIGVPDVYSLGAYYRAFLSITQFLRSKDRLSQNEQSRAFVRGFQPSLWSPIAYRLELKHPDHHPDDPYPLSDIYEAATYVLHRSTIAATYATPIDVPATAIDPRSTEIDSRDIATALDRCARDIIDALVPSTASMCSPTRQLLLRTIYRRISLLECRIDRLIHHVASTTLPVTPMSHRTSSMMFRLSPAKSRTILSIP
jgi:hypothetical protein